MHVIERLHTIEHFLTFTLPPVADLSPHVNLASRMLEIDMRSAAHEGHFFGYRQPIADRVRAPRSFSCFASVLAGG